MAPHPIVQIQMTLIVTTGQRTMAMAAATARATIQGRVASSCAGNVQRYGRGNTLPPPPWTQRKVHSPVLLHGGDTAKSVCSPSRGRVPDSSPWIVFCSFFTTTVQFTEQPSVRPPHYSGAQEPCQLIDALPPPLLQEPCQPIDNLPRLLLHFLSR